MPRRPTRIPTRSHAVAEAPPANHCRAVVRADGSKIRKKIRNAYEKTLRDLDSSRRVLDQFHQTDQPEFSRWLNSHFGELLTELRELNVKLAADDAIILLVENEAMFGGGSCARAYQRVMELRNNPEPPPPPGDECDRERDPFGARPETGNPDEEDDPIEAFFAAMFGELGHEEDSRSGSRNISARWFAVGSPTASGK